MRAISFSETGSAEVLHLVEREEPKPASDEVLIGLEYSGVNFIDTYHRSGLYPVDLPCIPGLEGVGVVLECGSEVTGFQNGML